MESENQFLQFEETGHLKAGVHHCTWEALQNLTFTNHHRKHLGGRLLSFLRWPTRMRAFPWVYIGGGFISDRPFPQDIDLILETQYPFGREAFAAVEPFFSEGLDKIQATYSVHLHFWMEGGPPALVDYRSFFQYQRPHKTQCFDMQRRGIVRLSLPPENLLEGFESVHSTDSSQAFERLTANQTSPQSIAA